MSETLHTTPAQESEAESTGGITLTLEELRDLGIDVNLAPQDVIDTEFQSIIEQLDPTEIPSLDPDTISEEGHTAWVESDKAGHITESGYSQRLSWRAGNVGHALDVVRDSITNVTDAEMWLELKQVVAAVKAMDDPYAKVDAVIELEKVGYDFAQRMDMDMSTFDGVRNK